MTHQLLPESSLNVAAVDHAGRQRLDGLFRSEASRLHRFFRRRTHCEEAAADMVQETFLRLVGSQTGWRLEYPLPYLQRIARNLLFDRSRSAEIRARAMQVDYDDDRDVAVAPEQGLSLEAEDLASRYETVLATMTDRTRQIFLLHRVDELSYRQISSRLGISVGTVEYHMTRALVQLDCLLGED